MTQDLISIIIPTYNRASLLVATLDSILQQSHAQWECLVVDDGSTDDTEAVVAKYAGLDSRFRYFRRPEHRNKGANACRNYGFEQSQGSFINWFDSDDLMHPNFLERKLSILRANDTLDFCACLQEIFQHDDPGLRQMVAPHVFQTERFEEDMLLNGLFFFTPSPLWKKSFLNGKPLFDENFSRAQEADFHFRMLSYQPRFEYLKEVLYSIRSGNQSISSGSRASLEAQQSVFEYFWRAFRQVLHNNQYGAPLKRYIFYRLSENFYHQSTMKRSFAHRLQIFKKYQRILRQCADQSKVSFSNKIRLYTGFVILLCSGKGYALFHFKVYGKAKKNIGI